MPNYYSPSVINPERVPKKFFTKKDIAVLKACNIEMEENPEGSSSLYLFSEEGFCDPNFEEPGLLKADEHVYGESSPWVVVLQNVLKRSRKAGRPIRYFTVEVAWTCTKMDPEGFGGSGYLITEDDVKHFSVRDWLIRQIKALPKPKGSPAGKKSGKSLASKSAGKKS